MAKEERTVEIYEVENAVEGQIIEDLLQEAGIPAMVSPVDDTAFSEYELAQKGWGRVIVLAEDQKEAERVLNEYLEAREAESKKRKAQDKKKKSE